MSSRFRGLVCGSILLCASQALAGSGSNYLQLMNGIDFFYGGFLNPLQPNGTHGAFRCIPSDILHAPTRVIDPNATPGTLGTYAAKISSLHFTACASTGSIASWPAIVLSSSDGDCRFAPGGTLNYAFASSSALFGGAQNGWIAVGPQNGSTPGQTTLLASILNLTFAGPFSAGPTGATIYGLQLDLTATIGGPSSIAVPVDNSVTYWMSDNPVQGPGVYQYWVASADEQSAASSLTFFASAIGTPGGGVFSFPQTFEWGMFVSTLDATLMAAVPALPFSSGPTMGTQNPIDTGTVGRAISLSLTSGGGSQTLSFNSYDEGNVFGGSGKIVFANVMAFNSLGQPSFGPWSPGYTPLATGGPGGPVLSTQIPQQPRLVGKIDAVALALAQNPLWLLATTHQVTPGGNDYPMIPGIPAAMGGSTGNNGGFALPIPNLPLLIGVQLYFSELGLTPSSTLARNANDGHSHSNGFATMLFP